jgi:hypothetical protein
MRNLIILLFVVLLFSTCKKQATTENCIPLKEAIATDNIAQVKTIITAMMDRMVSKDYTEQNLIKLTESISNQCAITSGVYCFDCIKTLPSQTEIWVSFVSGSTTVIRTIDISYTVNHKMVFVNMHN